MTGKGDVNAGGLPAEMDLLMFNSAGVTMAIDTVQVDCIMSSEEAEQKGIDALPLNKIFGMGKETSPSPSTVILHNNENEVVGIRVDGLDAIVTVPIEAIQPLPEPLSYFAGLRIFCGVVLHRNAVVLLIDPYRLKGLNPCPAAATA